MKSVLTIFSISMLMLTCFYPETGQAQIRNAIDIQEWSRGEVLLTTGERVEGIIVLHHSAEVIKVLTESGTAHSFSPVNVDHFVVTEMGTEAKRLFRTLDWDQGKENSDFKKPTFFEVLHHGQYSLVARESYTRFDASRGDLSRASSYDPRIHYMNGNWIEEARPVYYVLFPDGEVVQMRNIKKDLYRICGKNAGKIKGYVKKNKLKINSPTGLAQVFSYFNSLL